MAGELPGEIQRRIDEGEIPDPMWYVGRMGPGAQEVLDAEGPELAEFQAAADEADSRRLAAASLRRSRRRRQTSS